MKYKFEWTDDSETLSTLNGSIFGLTFTVEFNGEDWWNAFVYDRNDNEIEAYGGDSHREMAKLMLQSYLMEQMESFLTYLD